ncbi:hypothetical protein [Rugamonas apoptosis]|nr:hypothetical protein [Rugamonas apoptosis]
MTDTKRRILRSQHWLSGDDMDACIHRDWMKKQDLLFVARESH